MIGAAEDGKECLTSER